MTKNAGSAPRHDRSGSKVQLTPTSGLALGLAVSGVIWIGMFEAVRMIGLI